jgi:hypothetical protein
MARRYPQIRFVNKWYDEDYPSCGKDTACGDDSDLAYYIDDEGRKFMRDNFPSTYKIMEEMEEMEEESTEYVTASKPKLIVSVIPAAMAVTKPVKVSNKVVGNHSSDAAAGHKKT